MPFAIVQSRLGAVVLDFDWSIAEIEDVMNVSVHEFHRYEVTLSTRIVQDQSVRLSCFELKINEIR